jgi:HlyD family secretion protein
MKRKYVAIAIIALTIGAVLAYLFHFHVKEPTEFKTTGLVEAPEANISSMVSGTIVYECCREGDRVQKGQILVEQENSTLRASLGQAEAGVQRAQADVTSASSAIASAQSNIQTAKADIQNSKAGIEKARAQMQEARREKNRNEVLYKENAVAKATLDIARTNYQSSVADYNSSKAALANAESKMAAAEAQLKSAQAQFASSQANVKQSQANVDFYTAQLGYTVIRSPFSGTLIYKALQTGETADPGVTILTIVDQSNLWVRADVEETYVGGIKLYGPAAIRAVQDKSGREFDGKITEINRYAQFATQTDVTRGRQDIKTFKVRIAVKDESGYLKPGMTVGVNIPLKAAR